MPFASPEARRAFQRRRYRERKAGAAAKPPARLGGNSACAHCGVMFYRSPANRLRRGTNEYCGRSCMATAFIGRIGEQSPRWKGRETRACLSCSTPITRPPWSWNERALTFCDTGCFGAWKAANWTGNRNPSWVGGHAPYYGGSWNCQQRAARKRDGYCCQRCGLAQSQLDRALDVHHIRPFRLFGVQHHEEANALANLVSLCRKCHALAERESRAA